MNGQRVCVNTYNECDHPIHTITNPNTNTNTNTNTNPNTITNPNTNPNTIVLRVQAELGNLKFNHHFDTELIQLAIHHRVNTRPVPCTNPTPNQYNP
jgi:hypothetical protein